MAQVESTGLCELAPRSPQEGQGPDCAKLPTARSEHGNSGWEREGVRVKRGMRGIVALDQGTEAQGPRDGEATGRAKRVW